ncbi:Protein split ends [Harpegnathos saltator]|uniref:Msx2-interacting protein n=1 Tax=Harpegnathos saltator TaxID=610380 RepID=E2BUB2_HARSA|nr:Protein split ends [Harpegnathos saltator]
MGRGTGKRDREKRLERRELSHSAVATFLVGLVGASRHRGRLAIVATAMATCSVKLLPRGEECPVDGGSSGSLGEGNEGGSGSGSGGGGGGGGGGGATVAFMDIKSAAKAHATEHTLDERALTTQYYEPQHLQHRFPSHGARDRLYPRTGPYVSDRPPPPPHLDRHRGSLPPSSWSAYESTSSRYGNAPPPPSPATNDAYQDEQGGGGGGGSSSSGALRQHKKQRRKSRSGSSSPSGSSRSGSSSSSRSGSSGGSSTGSTSPGSSPHRTSNVAVTEDRRALAICVRNLPTRSSDTSLKDGLFHEYKKHGKVTWVKVVGVAGDRYALVCFKKPEDVEKALEVSHDKLFFGCKIEVAPYQGYDVDDNEFRPYEAELDEYHPKATRTLFIGNLEKDVTASELRKHFEPFGEIIEIDIKKQGAVSSYAFCQYSDIGSVVKAMRSMDGEHLGTNRIKLGFGKSMPTSCVWVDGIGDCMSEKYLNMQFHQFGPITQVVVDRERGQALVFFDQISCAQAAVKEMRGVVLRGRRLQVDFASRECQETFYEHLERQGNTSEKPWDSRPSPASSFDVTRERGSFDSAITVSSSCSRFTRYDTPPRSRTASYSRTSGGSTPGASPAHPTAMSRSSRRSYQESSYYDGDYGEPTSRRFRSYDEFSQGSGASHDDYQSSVLSDGKLNDDDCPPPSRRHAVQSVVTSVDPPAPPPPLLPPPDIRHLQKERVHLLEQLEECHSSGDEVGFAPKKRTKLDSSSSSTTVLCEDDEPEIASLLVTSSHSNRKSVDFRRVSDSKVVVYHSTRRSSCEGRGPGPCKRRRDATSRHHEHHDGSRPGTPLVDERPENLVPSEPRRFRERSHEGPLSLPLPRFAAQMLNNNNNNTSSSNNNNGSGSRSSGASLAKVASPPCTSFTTAPGPRTAPQPPASPPPRHPSSSPTSSDSETAPQSPSLEERIRSLDEKYEKWSGSRALSAVGGDALAKLDASTSERFKFRHKLLDMALHEVQPSDILKSVLAKRSVFDEDSKRLENYSEKYEPREFTGIIGIGSVSMIGSTAGLTTSSSCASKVCLQYPFPSHPPVQLSSSGTSITNMVGVNTLSTSLTPTTTTMVTSVMKTDPRIAQHNCIHPTPATPITPGTSIKTVSPELPPVSLPIGLGSGTVAGSGNNSLLSSNGSVGSIHSLGASTHRGLSISGSTASPTASTTSTSSTDAFFTTAVTTTAVPVTTSSTVTSSAATTTTSVIGTTPPTTTTSSIAPPSSITSSSNSSSSSSLSTSSTDLPRSRLRKESSASSRESRDSRDSKDNRESKHSKGKDCQRRSRKEETDVERSRKERDERESSNVVVNDIGETDNHSKDFKDNKELRYERKEREEKERRDKEDRDRQDRRDKEDRDRQERKEREEREKREKDEERRERERLDKERQEKDRREREERERERKEKEENELKEKERREKERVDRERREREEKERQERREREERERRERERKEREEREERERKELEKIRLEREKQEKERLRREREEQERREKEERDRLERERRREEKERLERERKREREEKERLERERRKEKEKEEREKMEKEKREKEERERLEKEKHEREKRKEREDQERRDKEKAEREKRRDREDKDKDKDKDKRERDDNRRQLSLQQPTENHVHPSVTSQSQGQITPAPVSIKRRCSSQDGPEEDTKRMKISDHRRDSKDRSRQNSRRSEDRKHRNDSHRSSRESRESRDSKESSGATLQDSRDGGTGHNESVRESNSRDNGKEKQKVKKNRSSEKESRERSPRVSHEPEKEFLSRLELPKSVDSSSSNEQASLSSNHARDSQHHPQQQSTLNQHSDVDDGPLSTHEIQVARHPSATDTDSDEPKKHSIFDIVDDEPAYISMYDKVKARSTKNMQKLEEEKRQVRLKDKFSQLKQSRARREEKKQSTSWDGDSVSSKALTEDEATSESDSTRTKSLSRKGSRSRIHSDTSEEEEPFNNKVRKAVVKSERFLESDVDLGFADTEEKQNRLEVSSVIVNSVHATIKEEPRTSDEDEKISIGFRRNHPIIEVINHERDSRKKSHKKKQKRQKNSISHENSLKTVEPTDNTEHKSKTNVIATPTDCRPNHGAEPAANATSTTSIVVATSLENSEERLRVDKKQRSKKDKRRDRNGEDKAKARRKRLNRQEARDSQRMEDIFGPLSDDVDDGPSNTFFNRFGNMTSENSVYASDSDGGRSSLDMDRMRRKTEKKQRRHQPEDENSVDLAEAGREIEAKLLGMPSSPKAAAACNEPNDHDVFRFTDDNDSIEPSTPSTAPEKVKEKKKKRKRSKEERSRKDYHHHHHHHHHHQHEKSGELPYLGAEPSPPRASSPLISKTVSPTLPTPREALLSPIPKATSNVSTASSITPPVVSSSIQTPKLEKKKDKLIPGFGIEIDETIHENAVKSISEPDERDSSQSRSGREEPEVSVPTIPPTQNEDKPRVAISQEETEDAVAALLEETFGASTEDFSYEGEEEEAEADGVTGPAAEAPQEDVDEMQQAVESLNASTGEGDADLKPDTPQSEHDLQIDTDTDQEDPNYETFDLTQPPKTPDIPSFYKSPTKTLNMTPVLTAPEKPIEMRLPPVAVTKPQSPPPPPPPPPPSSVIAHSWSLNEHKPREPVRAVQVETTADTGADMAASPERPPVSQAGDQESPLHPPSQYKQPMLGPCSVPITSEVPKLSATSPRPSPITTVQPLYQRLPVSPQSQMVPSMRQASPKTQNVVTVSSSSSSSTTNTTSPLPTQLGPSRIPPLVPSQLSQPRVSQPLSPNGQWSRNPTLSPHVPNVSKPSPPTTRIAVCVPISAQRLETPLQHIYSTAATQQPVIQHASGMLAPASGYPRGGLPPLTLNIPSRPFMPVSPLAPGMQVCKNSRDSTLSGKSVIETLLPVNPNEPPQRLEEPKLSPAVIPESTNKASTSPKVPSPNQPPTYIPETAKIEINASTSSPVFGKPACVTDSYMLSSRTQKQIPVSITTDSNLLSPRQKQELSNLQLLTTHVPRSSTPSPVIVAHGQSHLCHKPVHTLGPPTVSSPNQPLIKTVVPIVSQQVTQNTPNAPLPNEKCVISQTSLPLSCSRQSPGSQSQLVKSHVSLVSTVSQTIIARVVPSISTVSTSPTNEQATPECMESRITQAQQLELDAEAQIGQTAQPMQLTPPVQPTQPIDDEPIKQEPVDVKEEDTMEEAKYNIEFEKQPLNQPCMEDNVKPPKQEKQEIIKTEMAPCVPKVEVADTIVPKLEAQVPIKTEPVSDIKEEDTAKENDDAELDGEESAEDPLKEPSTDPLAIDPKEDATDSKEDSDYWSAKEVNIESVIKKVDALCDGEGNDADEGAQPTENANSDSHDTSKNESDWFDGEATENESKKGFASTDDHDEGVETCENESTRSRRGRTKSRRGCRGGVTTRRGGRNAAAAAAVSHRRGGRSPRGSKHHVEKNKLPADVYEFHDDSEEDNAGRPRLILTIKSPGPNVTGPNAQPATPVAAVKEVPPEEFVSPAANTRKSRRLAERDGSRNTVDDVIEDVVRGSPVNKGLAGATTGNVHATRRSTRHNSPRNVQTAQRPTILLMELRKSSRGGRKAARRTSENNDDSGEEKTKEAPATTTTAAAVTVTAATATTVATTTTTTTTTTIAASPREETPVKEEVKLAEPESAKTEEPAPPVTPTPPQKRVSLEPMTLIDPVTGDLIPMRESEEGQYIPVSTGQSQTTNRTQCEPRNSVATISASPNNETPRTKAPPTESNMLVPPEPKKEVILEHTPCQQPPPTPAPIQQQIHQIQQQVQPQTSVITKPQSPAVQVTSTISVAQSSTACTTITTVVTAPTITAAPTVLTCSSQAKPTSFKAHMLNASKLQGLNLQIPPSRVVSPSLSPRAKQTAQLAAANGKQGQPMSPVLNNTGAPPNPKQHLLQAAKQQTSTIVNMPQKLPLHSVNVNLVAPAPRIHQPVSQATTLKGINGQPHPLNPKTHLLQAVVPTMVTGTVASSVTQPHLVNPQSISGGVSCGRPSGTPKATAGTMEPQKMEVPMSGCIMVPTASTQPRSVPMPPYEAPLHGSAGATPPGSQYSLVPPHRSQSPPLPPPAHHHTNASQGDVVNHYGGLARGGELTPHYMFQYQYLRAQEALVTPRIAYHIPGTRSPHLPLDPKLEGGIEDNHSPPLELRRATRTPQERTTDSPQVAQVYMLHGGMRLQPPPQYNAGSNPSLPGAPAGARTTYYDPPPAHLRSQYPMTASEAPTDRAITPDRSRKHQVVTPPHASQVPPQADSFQMLLQRYPVMWQGLLALKNDQAAVQMHFVFGNPNVARDSLPCNSDGSTPPLRIAQRMRLEQTQVEGVARKMQTDNEHCMLLALPCGRDEVDVLQQSKNLQTGFIMYLQQKQAAGIVNIAAPGSQQPAYVVHIFPSCDFANESLARIAPDLLHRVAKIAHLLIVIATV